MSSFYINLLVVDFEFKQVVFRASRGALILGQIRRPQVYIIPT